MTHKVDWLNGDGYPTAACLLRVRTWHPMDFDGLAAFLIAIWHRSRYIDLVKTKDGRPRLCASTGGWSGNEDLIGALSLVWHSLYFQSHHRGGHWVFERLWSDDDMPEDWTLGSRQEGG